MSFIILNSENTEWAVLFEKLPIEQQDVFYSPAFAQLCQATLNKEEEVLCAAMTTDDNVLLYPFVKRDIGKLTGFISFNGTNDVTSLYGRGGIVSSFTSTSQTTLFYSAMSNYCHENNIVCGFDRFHPVIGNDIFSMPDEDVKDIGGYVVVDLRPKIEEIEAGFKYSLKKSLRKAENNGISCFAESNCDHLKEFLEIYNLTMDRNSASDFYYFAEEYFTTLEKKMSGYFHFFYALSGDEIVSCELVLHQGNYCHSFLGGTKREALSSCANQILKREIIRYMKILGCEYFLLGGGPNKDDGIFNYKKAFSPDGVLPSRIGGMVWDQQAYTTMKEDMITKGVEISTNRFQFYDIN